MGSPATSGYVRGGREEDESNDGIGGKGTSGDEGEDELDGGGRNENDESDEGEDEGEGEGEDEDEWEYISNGSMPSLETVCSDLDDEWFESDSDE